MHNGRGGLGDNHISPILIFWLHWQFDDCIYTPSKTRDAGVIPAWYSNSNSPSILTLTARGSTLVVRIWRLQVDPRTVRGRYNGRKPITKVFKWIGKSQLRYLWWFQNEKPFGLHVFTKIIQRCKGWDTSFISSQTAQAIHLMLVKPLRRCIFFMKNMEGKAFFFNLKLS